MMGRGPTDLAIGENVSRCRSAYMYAAELRTRALASRSRRSTSLAPTGCGAG
jgi:hypothetical protein